MIYFANAQPLDLDLIRIMGASAKDDPNSIGRFGTGLKFAISTLLRTGHRIWLNDVEFTVRKKTIRGKDFDLVRMGDEDLSFMTDLGIDWEPWMAFRELHSNTLDEGGYTSDTPLEGTTVIRVEGEGIEQAYKDRASIFLESEPLFSITRCEIHPVQNMPYFGFFRGIRAFSSPGMARTKYTYNVLLGATLTEDRTIKDSWRYGWEVARAILECDDETILEKILVDRDHSVYEATLTFTGHTENPSEAFMRVCERTDKFMLLPNVLQAYEKNCKTTKAVKTFKPDRLAKKDIEEALRILERVDCRMALDDFNIVENLGGNLGMYEEGEIFLAKAAIEKGPRFIASTLYEEWLHKTQGLGDMTRELQNTLLDRMFYFVEQTISYETPE